MSFDPLYALLVIVVLALPYLIWLLRADAIVMPSWPAISELGARVLQSGTLLAGLVLAMLGIVVLVALNSTWFARNAEEAPIIYRPPVDPLAREFVYFFAIAPALLGSLVGGLFNLDRVVGGAGVALLMSGLAVIVATGDLIYLRRQRLLRSVWAATLVAPALAVIAITFFQPWTGNTEVPTSMPANAIARFFGDSFERRTNQRLRAVTGDPQLATIIAMDKGRPHLLLDATPQTNPVAVGCEVQRDRRRGGVARLRYIGRTTSRYRAAVSRPGAGSAARLRMVGEWPAAVVARRLGDRAAESAVVGSSDCRVGKAQRAHHLEHGKNGGHGASAPLPTLRNCLLQRLGDRAQILPRHPLVRWRAQQIGRVERRHGADRARAGVVVEPLARGFS